MSHVSSFVVSPAFLPRALRLLHPLVYPPHKITQHTRYLENTSSTRNAIKDHSVWINSRLAESRDISLPQWGVEEKEKSDTTWICFGVAKYGRGYERADECSDIWTTILVNSEIELRKTFGKFCIWSSGDRRVQTTDYFCMKHSRRVERIWPEIAGTKSVRGELRRTELDSLGSKRVMHKRIRWCAHSDRISKGVAAWSARLPRRIAGDQRDSEVTRLILNAVSGDLFLSGTVSGLHETWVTTTIRTQISVEQAKNDWEEIEKYHDDISGTLLPPEVVRAGRAEDQIVWISQVVRQSSVANSDHERRQADTWGMDRRQQGRTNTQGAERHNEEGIACARAFQRNATVGNSQIMVIVPCDGWNLRSCRTVGH